MSYSGYYYYVATAPKFSDLKQPPFFYAHGLHRHSGDLTLPVMLRAAGEKTQSQGCLDSCGLESLEVTYTCIMGA